LPYGWKHQKNNATMEDDFEAGSLEEFEAIGNQGQATDSGKKKKEGKTSYPAPN